MSTPVYDDTKSVSGSSTNGSAVTLSFGPEAIGTTKKDKVTANLS